MSQFYVDPKRESDPYALPDGEVFKMTKKEIRSYGKESCWWNEDDKEYLESGWYYWYCLPGCLPDGEPNGPFESEDLAIEDARQYNEPDEDDDDAPDLRCDQCEACMINNVYCHETGCPNVHKVKVDGEWVTPELESDDDDN